MPNVKYLVADYIDYDFNGKSVDEVIKDLSGHIRTVIEVFNRNSSEIPVIRLQFLKESDDKRRTRVYLQEAIRLTVKSLDDPTWKGGEIVSVNPLVKDYWKYCEYYFDFGLSVYWRKGVQIHLTLGEVHMLLHKLVLHKEIPNWKSFAANLRQKHGKDFLKGYLA